MKNKFEAFLTKEALRLARARLEHLESLGLNLQGKRVLEIGAGIGLHTHYFEDLNCSIISTDRQPENVAEILNLYPYRRAEVVDLDGEKNFSCLGNFDIIYCYDTLHDLSEPDEVLKMLSQVCGEVLLLEAIVSVEEIEVANSFSENSDNSSSFLFEKGCYPTRSWILRTLKKYWGYSYISTYQPCHEKFPINWKVCSPKKTGRSVFVSSRSPIISDKLSKEIINEQSYEPKSHQVWLDVGSHLGELTFQPAQTQPWITVYAFEPNLKLASQMFGLLPNYIVIPVAISKQNGFSTFYLNSNDAVSSLRDFNSEGLDQWIGAEQFDIELKVPVCTIRLDKFLADIGCNQVDYLKIDAQGADFDVVLSLGNRLKDCSKVSLEVAITPIQLYDNAASKTEIVSYFAQQGFILMSAEKQSIDQEENLTFIRKDEIFKMPGLIHQLDTLEPDCLLSILSAIAPFYSLKSYPGWHPNIDWGNFSPEAKLRRAIWEHLTAIDQETQIILNWYFDLKISIQSSNILSNQLLISGWYEPNEFCLLDQVLQSGMTFIDFGAGDGLYALFAAKKVGEQGVVIAYEPKKHVFEKMQENLALNKDVNVMCLSNESFQFESLADRDTFSYPVQWTKKTVANQEINDKFTCISSQVEEPLSLDEWISSLQVQPDIIKIDNQSVCLSILYSGQTTLERFHPLVFIKLSNQPLKDHKFLITELCTFLKSLGYDIYIIGQSTGLVVKLPTTSSLTNNNFLSGSFIAIHPSRSWAGLTESNQIENAQTELEAAQIDLCQMRFELSQLRNELKNMGWNLNSVQTDLMKIISQVDEAGYQSHIQENELLNVQENSKQTQEIIDCLQNQIKAMESSKFWKLRNFWMRFRQLLVNLVGSGN